MDNSHNKSLEHASHHNLANSEEGANALRAEAFCNQPPSVHPSAETLKPIRQVQSATEPASITFSPLAPPGAHITYEGRGRTESVGGALRFTTTEERQTDRDKPFAHSQDGHLNDGYFGLLSSTHYESRDLHDVTLPGAAGQAIDTRTTRYLSPVSSMRFNNGSESPLIARGVTRVESAFDRCSGQYTTRITEAGNRVHEIVSDSSGRPIKQTK